MLIIVSSRLDSLKRHATKVHKGTSSIPGACASALIAVCNNDGEAAFLSANQIFEKP